MFDGGGDGESSTPVRSDWVLPGLAPTTVAAEPEVCASALVAAVDALLAQDPAALAGPVALERSGTLLAQADRLGVAVGTALLDVQDRELWADGRAGSMSGWLRQQPCGDGGRLPRSRRLASYPQVKDAVVDEQLGLATADVLAKALDDLPETTEPGQVEGVLTGAVPELLSGWAARNVLDPADGPAAAERAAVVQAAIDEGLAAVAATPAERLEAAYVLVGQAVAPAALVSQLALIADALQPERLLDAETKAYDGRSVMLTKKRTEPGWRLRGDLTDEVGAALHAEFQARAAAHDRRQAALRKAAEAAEGGGAAEAGGAGDAGEGDPELFGTAGPGDATGSTSPTWDGPEQRTHDLLGEVLDAVAVPACREPSSPAPTPITVVADLPALEGRLGALPGTLLLPTGPVPLSTGALRRLGCHSRLSAVLLDAARLPIGASGTHRSATERERRALHARWGQYCATRGCASTTTVPHHVRPWWLTGKTALDDLVPLCKGNHHDLHDGHRTLLLRDGRRIDENGWVEG